ncbi:hypothetical protein LTR36_010749 [Oleoguttula mirabilis]|uniref:Uncharacterized protein n=1 Tax=Oleoguttula mirabilis TaxID=1507867 RepID=A0AAV9JR03_9PEZI|nr:hypothetical protein LTR36_010749 [Oleoguttula mirabilis]
MKTFVEHAWEKWPESLIEELGLKESAIDVLGDRAEDSSATKVDDDSKSERNGRRGGPELSADQHDQDQRHRGTEIDTAHDQRDLHQAEKGDDDDRDHHSSVDGPSEHDCLAEEARSCAEKEGDGSCTDSDLCYDDGSSGSEVSSEQDSGSENSDHEQEADDAYPTMQPLKRAKKEGWGAYSRSRTRSYVEGRRAQSVWRERRRRRSAERAQSELHENQDRGDGEPALGQWQPSDDEIVSVEQSPIYGHNDPSKCVRHQDGLHPSSSESSSSSTRSNRLLTSEQRGHWQAAEKPQGEDRLLALDLLGLGREASEVVLPCRPRRGRMGSSDYGLSEEDHEHIARQGQQMLGDAQSLRRDSYISKPDRDHDDRERIDSACDFAPHLDNTAGELALRGSIHHSPVSSYTGSLQLVRDALWRPHPGERLGAYIDRITAAHPDVYGEDCRDRWYRLEAPMMPRVGEFKADYLHRMRQLKSTNHLGDRDSRTAGQAGGADESLSGQMEKRWEEYEGRVRPFALETFPEYVGRMLGLAGKNGDVGAVAAEARARWRAYYHGAYV